MKVKDILNITNGQLIIGNQELECENFSKDTRTIQKGDIYIGIKGEKSDGSEVWKQALDNGADAVIIARPFVTAVYGGGAEGVQALVNKLGAELEDTMSMCGAHSIEEINSSMIYNK